MGSEEGWNIKINEDKTKGIYFSHRIRPPESLLTINGQNIPFVNNVKYLVTSPRVNLKPRYTD
jgi:hypothetical protein